MRYSEGDRLIGTLLLDLYELAHRYERDADETDDDDEQSGDLAAAQDVRDRIREIEADALGIVPQLVDRSRAYLQWSKVARHAHGCACGDCNPEDEYQSYFGEACALQALDGWAPTISLYGVWAPTRELALE